MKTRLNLTLNQVFLLSVLSLTVLLGTLFYILLDRSRESILNSSTQIREQVGARIAERVSLFRDSAEATISDVEAQLRSGLLRLNSPQTILAALYAEVLNHPQAAEVTFTHADADGYNSDGTLHLTGNHQWQLSIYRTSMGQETGIVARRVTAVNGNFVRTDIPLHDAADLSATTRPIAALNPTTHSTFISSAKQIHAEEPLWSDLHNSELNPSQRVEVTVQKSLFDGKGTFLGVVRVGLLVDELNRIVREGAPPQHLVFLCDSDGVITPLSDSDRVELTAPGDLGELRIVPSGLPPQVKQALLLPAFQKIDSDHPILGGTIAVNGQDYLVTFVTLPRTQGWILGIVVPADVYLSALKSMQNELITASLLVILAILIGGILTLRAVQRGLSRVMSLTRRMRHFDFSASTAKAPFRDVQDVIDSIEQSKTAMRAMGKYVPVDLVRELYEMNREPVLGGDQLDISIMFTDIKGFTATTEMLSSDRLATALGLYLEAMTAAIQKHSGTIDKYIGDSVMVLWNAPRPIPSDAKQACAAALDCVETTRRLFTSPAWSGLTSWTTRYGLHRDNVRVGHFGSPTRMNYTALGDGVNLASRLEGLNKLYGTTIIVSQAIRDAAGDEFSFRLLDLVAVKGKTQAVKIFELLGPAVSANLRSQTILDYESALQACWNRDFSQALKLFSSHPDDPPSGVLADRCRLFSSTPPPADWNGVYVSMNK